MDPIAENIVTIMGRPRVVRARQPIVEYRRKYADIDVDLSAHMVEWTEDGRRRISQLFGNYCATMPPRWRYEMKPVVWLGRLTVVFRHVLVEDADHLADALQEVIKDPTCTRKDLS